VHFVKDTNRLLIIQKTRGIDFSICFLIEEILYHMIFSKGLEEEKYSMCFLVEEILIAIEYLTRRITLGKVFECVGCSLKYFEKTYYHM
jgi:hypothetical protein